MHSIEPHEKIPSGSTTAALDEISLEKSDEPSKDGVASLAAACGAGFCEHRDLSGLSRLVAFAGATINVGASAKSRSRTEIGNKWQFTMLPRHDPRHDRSEAQERSRKRRAARRHSRFSIPCPGVWNLSDDDPGCDPFVSTRRCADENRNDKIAVASPVPNIAGIVGLLVFPHTRRLLRGGLAIWCRR